MQTERILLRCWLDSDAAALYALASDPELGPRAGWPSHQSVAESLEAIHTYFNNDCTWAVVLRETQAIVGCVGYHTTEHSTIPIEADSAEVGYWMGRPYWNLGLCTEALRLVIRHCFREKGYAALWGNHFMDNPASGRVLEKCGFQPVEGETTCANLLVGAQKPVRVWQLTRDNWHE